MKRGVAMLKKEMHFRYAVNIMRSICSVLFLMLLVHHLIEFTCAVALYLWIILIDTGFRSEIVKVRIIAHVRHCKMKYSRKMSANQYEGDSFFHQGKSKEIHLSNLYYL